MAGVSISQPSILSRRRPAGQPVVAFGLRNPHADQGLGVFEVDHPATQAWKRDRIAQMSIDIPCSLIFAPVDFERGSLADGLAAGGFRPDQLAFFLWLGVVPYLCVATRAS